MAQSELRKKNTKKSSNINRGAGSEPGGSVGGAQSRPDDDEVVFSLDTRLSRWTGQGWPRLRLAREARYARGFSATHEGEAAGGMDNGWCAVGGMLPDSCPDPMSPGGRSRCWGMVKEMNGMAEGQQAETTS